MSFLNTLDEFGQPCNICQGYEVNKSPCASAACPQGYQKVENTLVDGGVFRHCAPLVNGKPTCKGFVTPQEQAINKKFETEKYMKVGVGLVIGLILIRHWQSS